MTDHTIATHVNLELAEMKKLGMRVPRNAQAYVLAHADEIEDYRTNGMKVSEIADLVCQLA